MNVKDAASVELSNFPKVRESLKIFSLTQHVILYAYT